MASLFCLQDIKNQTHKMATDLSKAPNLGKVVTEKLKKVGINDLETLREVGSENAYIRVRAIDNKACICMLYGLEGAVQGIRWHNLSDLRKNELKDFYKTLGEVKHTKKG
jgi:DNA transformation protein